MKHPWTSLVFLGITVPTEAAFVSSFSPLQRKTKWITTLAYKYADRARIEKTLEDMMDNDWREFRARLVAQEQVEAEREARNMNAKATLSPNHKNGNKQQQMQGQLGELFSEVISSIFQQKSEAKTSGRKRREIFNGDAVGGLIPLEDIVACDDPFVSEGELPIHIKNPVTINKHRWAHILPQVEPGCVLVANEKLGGIFHQTVILVIDHSDKHGSTGFIINRPLDGNVMKIGSQPDSKLDLSLKMAFKEATVSFGGPINPEEFAILHGFGEVEGARRLAKGVFVGGSEELMNEVRMNSWDPKHVLFAKGHAAWVSGQLSREVSKGVWYPAAVSSDFVLRYAGAPTTEEDDLNDLWRDILTCMGGKYADVAKNNISRGDRRMAP